MSDIVTNARSLNIVVQELNSTTSNQEKGGIGFHPFFIFGMGICITILSCTLFMICSSCFDRYITKKMTKNLVFVVSYMDEQGSSHVSELETWNESLPDADSVLRDGYEDRQWIQVIMTDLLKSRSRNQNMLPHKSVEQTE